MNNTFPDNEQHIIELIGTYLKYRAFDAVRNTGKSTAAYQSLEQFGFDRVFEVAQGMLDNSDANLRCRGAEILLRINSYRAMPLVMPLLCDPQNGVRSFVCGIVHDLGDSRAEGDLIRLLQDDTDDTVRHHAAFALERIGTPTIVPILERIAKNETKTDWEGHPIRMQLYQTIKRINEVAELKLKG